MVFESIVVELVNRYLGAFVENLDSSQLSIGIWGGDVVLNQLSLKESALDNLDLPVKIKTGHLGKLTLKVPWKSLYTEPVVAHIDGIYALAVPNIGIKYNEEKIKKAEQDDKQAKLAMFEEQKKLDAEKDKPKDPKQDSFAEKLATQVIKNLQIKVSNIHVRYEDKYTNPDRPFSIGVTLQELVFQTTDANWKETVIKEAVTQIYKLIRLDSLSVYWNNRTELLQDKDSKQILAVLSENIAKQGYKPNLQYLFKPISAVAHLRLNTKPELMDFTLPKIFLTLVFDEIAVALSKDQFDDVLEMLESLERMNLLGKYKKTRPDVPVKGNSKRWWLHAYAVTLEHYVRHRREMWNWNNMKRHRACLKQYREIYTQKLDAKKLGSKEQDVLKNLENRLDVFNICISRNQAELDAARLGKKRAADKAQGGGWMGGWFGGNKKKANEKANGTAGADKFGLDLGNKFQEEFTDEEKLKLYKAIGYDENAKDPTFPNEFVAVRLVTKLNKLSLALVDRKNAVDSQLLKLSLTEICASFGQRPAASAIRLDVKVDRLRATGSPRKDYTPKMISSVGVSKEENTSLLTLTVETHPLDGLCDSRIRVQSRPLEIVYDAITINGLAAFFRPPESVKLKQLSNAAMAKYDEIKTQTTAGVAHMMSERKYADIEVRLMPSYIIVPETGELKKDVNILLLNLGSLNITSEKTKEVPVGVQLSSAELAPYAYDKFNIGLDNVQLLFVQSGVNWQDVNQPANSPLYILRPMSIQLLLEKCLFANDPNLPQIRVSGELPLVSVVVSDHKLLGIMKLAQSIPLPEPAPEPKIIEFEQEASSTVARVKDVDLNLISQAAATTKQTTEYTNLTQASLAFIIKEISLEIRESSDSGESPLLKLIVTRIGANVKARTFDLAVEAYLGGIFLQHLQYKISPNIQEQLKKCEVATGEIVNIINSPFVDDTAPLLSVQFIQADKKGPEFKTTYNNTAQSIRVAFSALDVVLHQGVLLSLLDFAKRLEPPPSASSSTTVTESASKKRLSITSTTSRKSVVTSSTDITKRTKPPSDILQLQVKALVDSIQLSICNANCVIMHSKVEGIEVGVGMQEHKMDVTALMRKIELIDPDPLTFHPKIFSVHGTEMLKFEMTQYKNGTEGKQFEDTNNVDIAVALQMGRARIVFVNKFVTSLVNFLDNFSIAKAKLDEAGQAMKEASKDVAKNLQEKAPRVKLDIMVKAPLVVVPQHSKSGAVLLINLGDIAVKNTFKRGSLASGKSSNAVWVAENMTVTLTNLRLSRGIFKDEEGNLISDVTILEPMTFTIDLCRNLSTSYFHGIPDVEVRGLLEKIEIKLSQEDVRLLMLIGSENIEERNPDSPQPVKKIDKQVVEEKRPHTDSTLSAIAEDAVEEFEKPTEVYSTLKVDFELHAINVELYSGLGTTERPPDKLLTYLTLKMLGVNLDMRSDTSMGASVYLHDINMDDCRVDKSGGITAIIRRTAFKTLSRAALKARETEEKDHMVINLTFEQNSTQDKIINIHICSLHLCVCVEFLMKVAEFFTKALPEKKVSEDAHNVHHIKPIQESKDKAPAATAPTTKPPMVGSIDLNLKLEKPEIYLIENQMNLNTDSLIVNMELVFRVRMTSDVLSVNGGIRGLSFVSCIFGMEDTRQSVLAPVDISIIGNAPEGKDHHMDVSVTDFIITISPSTIRLLAAVAAGLSAAPEAESIVPKLKDYSSIWSRRQLEECNYWFTQSGRHVRAEVVDIGSSVDEKSNVHDISASPARGELTKSSEKLILSAPVIVLKLEGGVGHRTVPLLIIESSFSSQVHNWSSDMYIESSLGVEIAYSNEKQGVWEPIIEPVMDTCKSAPHKWGLSVEVIKNQEELQEDEEGGILPPPKMSINVVATEPLQLLVTKTCLDVLGQLGQAFSQAYQLTEFEGTLGEKIIPFVFKNRLGKELVLRKDASFEPAPEYENVDLNHFPNGKDAYMVVKTKRMLVAQDSLIRSTQHQDEKRISFQLADSNVKHEVSIKQARVRMFSIDKLQVVVKTEAQIGQKVVLFVSLLQVKNHLKVPIEVRYNNGGGLVSAGEVTPGNTFPVSLDAVYSATGEIFFQPKMEDGRYAVSKEGVAWKGLQEATKVKQISCEATQNGQPAYYFNVLPQFEKVCRENTEDLLDHVITLHLHPTVILHNLLPSGLQVTLEGTEQTCTLESGSNTSLSYASVNHSTLEIKILEYRGHQWKGKKQIRLDAPELSILTFQTEEGGKSVFMDLGLHSKEKDGSFDLTVYSPYWIINLTDQDIALKEDDKESPLVHTKGSKDIMLFYFRDKTLFGATAKRKESSSEKKKEKVKELKKPGKVSLKIGEAEWSDKFSMDTVGSSGNITCKNKAVGNNMEVGVQIKLASSGLTKIVTFTPFYLLINASTIPVSVKEVDQSAWVILDPGECKGFYPQTVAKEMTVVAKVQDSDLVTVPFFFNKAHTTLLRLDDNYGGINAECQVSESAMITTFKMYKPGMATVLFVNHTSQCTIVMKQTGSSQEDLNLEPLTSQLYTWTDPAGLREVTWSCGEKKNAKSTIDQDKIEEFFAQNNIKVYFVSFLDGMQRVVMFTEDLALATVAQEAGELEQADQEINLKIHDMGFSLINNEKMVELVYMGITSSGVIWEEKRKRFKAMKLKDAVSLEQSYQKYLLEVAAGKAKSATVTLENKMEVDFENMKMIKPSQHIIRRSFEDGIWVQLRKSPHSMQFHAKFNRLQIDNQLRQAIFPTILSPLPPPKSVAADSVPKPFIEASLMTRIHEHSDLLQIKYFKILIQEMNLKIDHGFLNALLAMFASDVHTLREKEPLYLPLHSPEVSMELPKYVKVFTSSSALPSEHDWLFALKVAQFNEDVALTKRELKEEAGVSMQAKRVSFYDYFHISPIKIHVSFSLQVGSMSDTPQANILGVFLQSVGVVLTDVQDVVFKLGYFERNHCFYNNSQLMSEFVRHYSGQAIKQMYVLVLGLDVLGNPFGLLRGLSEGIEDLFYEPYQGAIQGPEEFAEGLALGVRSLFGHAVGGAAGAVSRITGTLGKGLAALTLDDDYQKKRREQLNKRPATAREGFARGGKGLVMGVFDGVTGIVRKPVEGAKQEGVAGFFKGMGKGLVGVVTRPTSGVVDFASSSLEGIRRITDFTEEIHRLRPPRRFNRDGIIRPYIREEAEGYNLLLETDKGKYVETDEYITHVKVKEDGKTVFIVTDKRIMLAKRGEIFGAWDTEWVFAYTELKGVPKQSSKGIEVILKEKEKKKLFGSNVTKKDVAIADVRLVQDVLGKITDAMEADKIESGV